MLSTTRRESRRLSLSRHQPQQPPPILTQQQAALILAPVTPNDGPVRISLALMITTNPQGTAQALCQDNHGPYIHWNPTPPSTHAITTPLQIHIPNTYLTHSIQSTIEYITTHTLPSLTRTDWKWIPQERWHDVTFMYLTLVQRPTGVFPETQIPVVYLGMLQEIVHCFRTQPVFMERFTLEIGWVAGEMVHPGRRIDGFGWEFWCCEDCHRAMWFMVV